MSYIVRGLMDGAIVSQPAPSSVAGLFFSEVPSLTPWANPSLIRWRAPAASLGFLHPFSLHKTLKHHQIGSSVKQARVPRHLKRPEGLSRAVVCLWGMEPSWRNCEPVRRRSHISGAVLLLTARPEVNTQHPPHSGHSPLPPETSACWDL